MEFANDASPSRMLRARELEITEVFDNELERSGRAACATTCAVRVRDACSGNALAVFEQ